MQSVVRQVAILALLGVGVSGCATVHPQRSLVMPDELHDVQSRTEGAVTVSVSILRDDQARQHFDADLAKHDVQVLWVRVRNESARQLWFIRNILDPDFFSADEVALLLNKATSSRAHGRLRQQLHDDSMRVAIAPRTETEGFVYLPRVEGGRYVDLRLQLDAYGEEKERVMQSEPANVERQRELRFEFAVALPDGHFDYERLDGARTYAGLEFQNLTGDELRRRIEALPCCAVNKIGDGNGDPLNIVLVGDRNEILNSLSRSGWSFTHRIDFRTVRRMVGAAIAGDDYLVAPVSDLFAFGRAQDLSMQRARHSISRRNHMRLWLAPFLFENRSVWVGQVSRDIGIKITSKSSTLTTHIIDPQVDATREYFLHSLMAQGFVDRFGFAKGGAFATPETPRFNLTDDPYFSDGLRVVVILAPQPVAPDRIRSLLWERSAAPIAEGQSEAARRNTRSIDPDSNEEP